MGAKKETVMLADAADYVRKGEAPSGWWGFWALVLVIAFNVVPWFLRAVDCLANCGR
jgi:hypothetical protein